MEQNHFLPNFILLYVAQPKASAAFYADLFGYAAIETSPTFSMFALPSGVMFGLWAKHTVLPTATAPNGCGELACAVDSIATVDNMYQDWQARGLTIAQTPTTMDFGYTFVALDPDGNRLRIFAPSGQ